MDDTKVQVGANDQELVDGVNDEDVSGLEATSKAQGEEVRENMYCLPDFIYVDVYFMLTVEQS